MNSMVFLIAIIFALTGLLILLFECFRVFYPQSFVSPRRQPRTQPRTQSRTQQGVPDVEPAGPPSPPGDLPTPPAASRYALLALSSAQALLVGERIRRRSISTSNRTSISYPSSMSSHASLDSVFLHSGETPEPRETNRNPTEADTNYSDVRSNCMSNLDSHSSDPSNNETTRSCRSDSSYSDAKSTQMTTVDQRPISRVSSNNEPTTTHLSVSAGLSDDSGSQTQTRHDTDPAVTSEDIEMFHHPENVDRSNDDGSHMETSHSDPAPTLQDPQSILDSESIEDLIDRRGYMDDYSPFRAYLSVNLQPPENSDRSSDTGGSTETFHPNSPDVTSQRLSTFGGFKCTSVGRNGQTGISHINPAFMSKDLKESEVLESVDLPVGSDGQMRTSHPGSAPTVAENLSACQVLESREDHRADDNVCQSPTSESDSTTSSEDLETRRLLESADQSDASGS